MDFQSSKSPLPQFHFEGTPPKPARHQQNPKALDRSTRKERWQSTGVTGPIWVIGAWGAIPTIWGEFGRVRCDNSPRLADQLSFDRTLMSFSTSPVFFSAPAAKSRATFLPRGLGISVGFGFWWPHFNFHLVWAPGKRKKTHIFPVVMHFF